MPLVELLLAHGANIELVNAHGETALMYAVRGSANDKQDPLKIISLLIEKGANVHTKNNKGEDLRDLARHASPPVQALIMAATEE